MAPLDGFNLLLCAQVHRYTAGTQVHRYTHAQVAPLVENKHWWSFFSRVAKLYKCDSEDADIHKPWSPPPSVARANISLTKFPFLSTISLAFVTLVDFLRIEPWIASMMKMA